MLVWLANDQLRSLLAVCVCVCDGKEVHLFTAEGLRYWLLCFDTETQIFMFTVNLDKLTANC